MGNAVTASSSPEEPVQPKSHDDSKAQSETAAGVEKLVEKTKETSEGEDGESDERPGLIQSDGSINWDCPCLGGMAHGPCGEEFRAAFSCFHYSKEDQKGSDCLEPFMTMQSCFQKYPEIFGPKEGEDEEFEAKLLESENARQDVENSASDSSKERLETPEKTSVQIK